MNDSSIDDLFTSAMIADGEPNPEIGKSVSAFPEYPDEKPRKVDLVKWLDTWGDDLVANGYGAVLCGETPYLKPYEGHRLSEPMMDLFLSISPNSE